MGYVELSEDGRESLADLCRILGQEGKDWKKEDIAERLNLIKDGDRELFEDILANTVGRKIRGKINSSNAWVGKMNALMESMNTSSGLKLSLRWRSRTAETEDQFEFWHMRAEDYESCRSNKPVSDRRLKSLQKIRDERLFPAVRLLREWKVAGYQEKLLEAYKL